MAAPDAGKRALLGRQVDAILDARWKRTRAKERYLVILIALLILLGIWNNHFFLLWIIVAALIVFVLPIGLRDRREDRQYRKVVLWIRRFQQGPQSKKALRLWEACIAPWGRVVTLCDHTVKRPLTLFSTIFLVLTLICFLALLIPSSRPYASVSANLEYGLFSWCVGWVLLSPLLLVEVRFSTLTIRTSNDLSRLPRFLARIRKGKHGPSKFIRCAADDEETWKRIIEELAPQIGAVILDYGGGMSENMEWEVRTLLTVCGPSRIVVALPSDTPADAVSDATGSLREILGQFDNPDEAPQVLICPSHLPSVLFRILNPRFEALVRPIQKAIGVASLSG